MDASPAKIVTSVTLAPALVARLDRYADAEERSRSWVISRALDLFLQNSGNFLRPPNGDQSDSAPPKNPECRQGETPSPPWPAPSYQRENRMDAAENPHSYGLYTDTLRRKVDLATQRHTEANQARDAVQKQTADYIGDLDKAGVR